MSTWRPTTTLRTGPLYLRLAEAIAADVATGALAPGTRLPTHREMADALDTTVTTVAHGYQEAARRGLVTATVGRGTFVRDAVGTRRDSGVVDLSVNALGPGPFTPALLARVAALTDVDGAAALVEYHTSEGRPAWRETGAGSLRDMGVPVTAEQVIITAGAQHAVLVALISLTRPRDRVLVEDHTYPGVKAAVNSLGLRLEPVAMDNGGLRPDSLAAACRRTGARVLYTMPTFQNPTAVTMSRARRKEIVKIAAAHDLLVVEDDSYGFLANRPPLASLAPGRCWYLTSASKSLAAGTRVGYLRVPDAFVSKARAAVAATLLMASPFTAELVGRWTADGTARQVIAWKRDEYAARHAIARRVLRLRERPSSSPHVWLTLPDRCPAHDFVAQARQRGVIVTPSTAFAVRTDRAHNAVRVCLGPPATRDELESALRVLSDIRGETLVSSTTVV